MMQSNEEFDSHNTNVNFVSSIDFLSNGTYFLRLNDKNTLQIYLCLTKISKLFFSKFIST